MKNFHRIIMQILAISFISSAMAEDFYVRDLWGKEGGDTVDISNSHQILYISRKCKLPLQLKNSYKAAEMIFKEYNQRYEACWIPLFPTGLIVIDENGGVHKDSEFGHFRVKSIGDGSFKVIGPMYNDYPNSPYKRKN
ncbi:hypothetical protein [Microvirgula aerodenitrificans]|uniref:hypothetical protein n=1 Tax=Microvirgula aerodenitrificans TaxID=57480 RepID=UPI00248F090A|nr:hypothetical protein [Microvirgula aerodenitrificans]